MIGKINESLVKFTGRNAFFIRETYYTYGQVAAKVSDIHRAFRDQIPGLSPKHIGVMIYEDIESYAACICVLLSGCGYVPLNPLNPAERNREVMAQSDIKVLLSSRRDQETQLNPDGSIHFICTTELNEMPVDLNFLPANDEDPAYVIFTSGSTGNPKGAPISRGNLAAFLDSVWNIGWRINENDRFLQMSSMTFDMSILTFIIPLCVGACIYTVPEDEIKYIYGYRLMEEQQITFIALVPSTLSYLKPYFSDISLPHIKYSLVCGEAFPIELADHWQVCAPNSEIVNIYGPTEATVFTHSYHYRKGSAEKSHNGIMALGDLVKNMETIILDEGGKEVPEGEQGQLCISGLQLTSGYLKNLEKNSESFFLRTIGKTEKRYYKTGDIVYRDASNQYFYIGRSDYQVKIQGHRVELGEIEKHSRDIAATERAIAVAHMNQFGNYQIHLFLEKPERQKEEVMEYLKSKVPYYMVPANISIVNSMPLNINGKIDRLSLARTLDTKQQDE